MRSTPHHRLLSGALLILLCACFSRGSAESLPRRLDFGWALEAAPDGVTGATVMHVAPGGAAARAGVRVGDRVLEVNGSALASPAAVSALRFGGPPGRRQRLLVQRGHERFSAEIEPREKAREVHADVTTEWGSIEGPNGLLLRTIITRPRHTAPTPAIFIVGWLSCDTVEIPAVANPDPVAMLLRDLAERSGATLFRVDKPGCGDSEGVCAATDFLSELEGYRKAWAALRADPEIDSGRTVVVGISNGGGFAPLVVGESPVAGYVTVGGWSKTWFEHMVDLERRRVALAGTPPGQIDAILAKLTEFHAAYLFDELTPAQVARSRRHLAGIWYDEPDSQYGRPARFYHQLQRLDLASAWSNVRVPTLVVWGEYDWIMDRADQEQIVRLVNAHGSGLASLLISPQTDHSFAMHDSPQSAFERMGEGPYAAATADHILQFVRRAARLE
jgi:pimeloyl-ACP methyl ester carboxylesterase